jgi:hypothetical protein
VDFDALIRGAGDAPVEARLATPDLPAKLIGPGRFGISHTVPGVADADGLLRDWSAASGESPRYVENLFRLFMSADHGDICGATPKCAQCEVRICKRLRYR